MSIRLIARRMIADELKQIEEANIDETVKAELRKELKTHDTTLDWRSVVALLDDEEGLPSTKRPEMNLQELQSWEKVVQEQITKTHEAIETVDDRLTKGSQASALEQTEKTKFKEEIDSQIKKATDLIEAQRSALIDIQRRLFSYNIKESRATVPGGESVGISNWRRGIFHQNYRPIR